MSGWSEAPREARVGAVRFAVRETVGIGIVAGILLGGSGRTDWLGGWVVVGLYVVWVGATLAVLMPRSPGLLAERAVRRRSPYRADNVALGVHGAAALAKHGLAAARVREGPRGTSGSWPWWRGRRRPPSAAGASGGR